MALYEVLGLIVKIAIVIFLLYIPWTFLWMWIWVPSWVFIATIIYFVHVLGSKPKHIHDAAALHHAQAKWGFWFEESFGYLAYFVVATILGCVIFPNLIDKFDKRRNQKYRTEYHPVSPTAVTVTRVQPKALRKPQAAISGPKQVSLNKRPADWHSNN